MPQIGDLVTKVMEKPEILNVLFISFFTGKVYTQTSQVPKPSRICWSMH